MNNYTVTGQTEGYILDATSGAVQAMTINATTNPYDVAFTVQVAMDDYTPAKVNALLTERAAAIIAVHNGESA